MGGPWTLPSLWTRRRAHNDLDRPQTACPQRPPALVSSLFQPGVGEFSMTVDRQLENIEDGGALPLTGVNQSRLRNTRRGSHGILSLYLGCTLDFMSRSCTCWRHDGQEVGRGSPRTRDPCTNATGHIGQHE